MNPALFTSRSITSTKRTHRSCPPPSQCLRLQCRCPVRISLCRPRRVATSRPAPTAALPLVDPHWFPALFEWWRRKRKPTVIQANLSYVYPSPIRTNAPRGVSLAKPAINLRWPIYSCVHPRTPLLWSRDQQCRQDCTVFREINFWDEYLGLLLIRENGILKLFRYNNSHVLLAGAIY